MSTVHVDNLINNEYNNIKNTFTRLWETQYDSYFNLNIHGISQSYPSENVYNCFYKRNSYHVNGNFYIWGTWDNEYSVDKVEEDKPCGVFILGTREIMIENYKRYVKYYHDKCFQAQTYVKYDPDFCVYTWDEFIEGTIQLGDTTYLYTSNGNYTDGHSDEF